MLKTTDNKKSVEASDIPADVLARIPIRGSVKYWISLFITGFMPSFILLNILLTSTLTIITPHPLRISLLISLMVAAWIFRYLHKKLNAMDFMSYAACCNTPHRHHINTADIHQPYEFSEPNFSNHPCEDKPFDMFNPSNTEYWTLGPGSGPF